ncbi:hypothetical protein H8B13_00300 [Hymenobacter sp. BT188]|uniref:hypothetical protein n=1 Tax=Hymenobacter sp. BT188 TaxID=2763504 RepID=UPI0016514F6C|nr:hypothetical protein [Hymenobacter sp. BT188]MBC6605249.1 hypothetical protein [Hymenobacter sp. BT188]
MADPTYDEAIRRIRRMHWLHYSIQAAVMAALVLAASRRTAGSGAVNPQLATWPALLLLGGLLLLVGVLVYLVSSQIKPNLRRPAVENLRLYKSRVFLRNSLLGLAGLPPLITYTITRSPIDLLFFGCLLLTLCVVMAPSAKTYQRWLIR